MFSAPQWHGATQTHFPPRPRKSARHCDITDVIRHTVSPHSRSNPITRYRQSSRSQAARRVYASVFRAPQWHGVTQMHFPPRPRKSAWHCVTNVASPHGLPTLQANMSHDTANHRAHQRHAAFTPACFALLSARRHANTLPTQAAQIPMALRHHGRNSPHGLPTQ